MSTPGAAFACAEALLRALRAGGLRGVVISPGSRSTPLAIAASRLGMVEEVILDERSAAFFALGRADRLRAPVAAVCTSGTAGVNHAPAVVEASLRGIPLVVITADRPPELHGIGANQTIEHEMLHAGFAELVALPVAELGVVEAWAAAGMKASAERGPTHLNAPFREPFIPVGNFSVPEPEAAGTWDGDPARSCELAPEPPETSLPSHSPVRGLISLGPGCERDDIAAARSLARERGWPILASVLSGSRTEGTIGAMTIDEQPELAELDIAIHLGRSHTTRGVNEYLARARRMVTIDRAGRTFDPGRASRPSAVTLTGAFDPEPFAALAVDPVWREQLDRSEAAVESVRQRWQFQRPLCEPTIARIVASCLREDEILFVGNSTPVRDLEGMVGSVGRRVTANRGASGIDGLVSTLAGLASGGPATGLLGDLSVLHDASGLLWLAPLVAAKLVVVDNGGGGIFDMLGSRDLPEHQALFRTPHQGRLGRLLVASGANLETVEDREGIEAALASARGEPPMRVIIVKVDPEREPTLRAQLRSEVRAAISQAS